MLEVLKRMTAGRVSAARFFCWRALTCVFLLSFVAMGLASSQNLAFSMPQRPTVSAGHGAVRADFAIADFDGDSSPDLATVEAGPRGALETYYAIAFQLSTGSRQVVGITAPSEGLRLASGDVNGDSFLDLIVTTAWTNRPVAVLVNDGRGNFTASSPAAFPRAFSPSGASLVCPSDELKDTSVVVLSRSSTRDCEQGKETSEPTYIARLQRRKAFRHSNVSPVSTVRGRAPPVLA